MKPKMSSFSRDWYHRIGHMVVDIELAIGTEPMAIYCKDWLTRPLWSKKEAVLLVCGLEPNTFHEVEQLENYESICKPFIQLLQRSRGESDLPPFCWLNKFEADGYSGCVPRGVHKLLTRQNKQAQLKLKTETVDDGGVGGQTPDKKSNKLRSEHITDWVKRTEYTGGKADKTINSALQTERPDLWGENLYTFRKWMLSDDASAVKHLLPN